MYELISNKEEYDISEHHVRGYLGRDPVIRTNSVGKVACLSIAVNKPGTVYWLSAEVTDPQHVEELEKRARKGSRIYLEGDLVPLQNKNKYHTNYITVSRTNHKMVIIREDAHSLTTSIEGLKGV